MSLEQTRSACARVNSNVFFIMLDNLRYSLALKLGMRGNYPALLRRPLKSLEILNAGMRGNYPAHLRVMYGLREVLCTLKCCMRESCAC